MRAHDFAEWDGLLKKHVKPKTIAGVELKAVDYSALSISRGFKKVIDDLKIAKEPVSGNKKETIAFWTNVYNILAIALVVKEKPKNSIKDIGNFLFPVWKEDAGVVSGKMRTLNEIEHGILRKMGDPRIHAAIVCASVSCPDLRTEAFTPQDLDKQLDEQMRVFLENDKKGFRLDATKNRAYLSSIFDWFDEDFEAQGGVLKFIRQYLPDKDKAYLDKKPGLSFFDYNWDLNKL